MGSTLKKAKKAPENPDEVPTVALAAQALNVSQGALYSWLSQGCPGKKRGRYNVAAIRQWRETNLGPANRRKHNRQCSGLEEQLLRARISEREAKSEIAKLQAEFQKGEFVPLEDHKALLTLLQDIFTQALTEMENDVSTKLEFTDEREARTIWRELVRDLLTRLSTRTDQ